MRSTTMSGPAIARSAPPVEPRDPGHDRAVVEAQHQLGAHRDPAAPPTTRRTRSDTLPSRGGMKSIKRDRASRVSKRVSRISVSGR